MKRMLSAIFLIFSLFVMDVVSNSNQLISESHARRLGACDIKCRKKHWRSLAKKCYKMRERLYGKRPRKPTCKKSDRCKFLHRQYNWKRKNWRIKSIHLSRVCRRSAWTKNAAPRMRRCLNACYKISTDTIRCVQGVIQCYKSVIGIQKKILFHHKLKSCAVRARRCEQ